MDLLCHTHTHTRDMNTEIHTHGPPWTQGALSFFLSLHFPAVYFGQLVARSHSAAVPMVIAVEIANGGWGVCVLGLMESGRDSVALFEEIGDYVAVEEAGVKRGGVGGGWMNGMGLSV